MAAFGTDTEDGRNIGSFEENSQFVQLVKQCIDNRYKSLSKNLLLVSAYLICGDRMWEHLEVPKITANMTSSYYVYLERINCPGTGNNVNKSLYEEAVDYLVNMVGTLKLYKIGTEVDTSSATNKREIESWINLSLPQYIRTSLVAESRKYTKRVDWARLAIENAVVANLGIFY